MSTGKSEGKAPQAREVKVDSAQQISRMCFVCGEENGFGLHSRFLVLADGRVAALFTAQPEHQGYPGRMHGGIISAVMDELIGRVMQVADPDAFAVTIELGVKYRKPVPLGVELKAVGWALKDSARAFEGAAELYLADGSVAIQATGRYLKLPVEDIASGFEAPEELLADPLPLPESISW